MKANSNVDVVVDASGLSCPLPILRTYQALLNLSAGKIIKVIATDPTSQQDFPVFAKQTGCCLIAQQVESQTYIYYLQVGHRHA